ncbi:substrate-binding domain-containing protein [Vibrio lamellibrachiae]|uniref:LacI family DNA-binding transcriptional regulator n=1 Tax=Vibrio lamellibrachiae TaxID=2910253 RepID=UPI003D119E6F
MAKVTSRMIAAKADVSPSTVSRYINRSSFIEKEKVLAIEKAMSDLGYRQKDNRVQPAARTMVIGVLSPSYDSVHVSSIFSGMNKAVSKHVYKINVEVSNYESDRERRILKDMVDKNVDGVIIIGTHLTEEEIGVILKGVPKLIFGTPALSVNNIGSKRLHQLQMDNELGAYLAVNHLIQKGHSDIVHLRGPVDNSDSDARYAGYVRAMESAGIEINHELVLQGDFNSEQSSDSIRKAVSANKSFTAIFASNDESAVGAMNGLYREGLTIPNDIAVVGYDDMPLSSYIIPPLTTVRLPFEKMGELSISYILDLISGNEPKYKMPTMQLIIREST